MEPAEEQSCALGSNQLSTVLLTLVVVLLTTEYNWLILVFGELLKTTALPAMLL